jgi:hypothetical protein
MVLSNKIGKKIQKSKLGFLKNFQRKIIYNRANNYIYIRTISVKGFKNQPSFKKNIVNALFLTG